MLEGGRMLFQSQGFILLFLPAVLGAYYLSAERLPRLWGRGSRRKGAATC